MWINRYITWTQLYSIEYISNGDGEIFQGGYIEGTSTHINISLVWPVTKFRPRCKALWKLAIILIMSEHVTLITPLLKLMDNSHINHGSYLDPESIFVCKRRGWMEKFSSATISPCKNTGSNLIKYGKGQDRIIVDNDRNS